MAPSPRRTPHVNPRRTPHVNLELRRFARTRMARAALVVAVCIPLLYGALYLWAFWNPTGNLEKMPVALVNVDTGATTSDGDPLTAGDDVVSALTDKGTLDWQVVSPTEAASGLQDGRYFATLTIPDDFSAAVATLGTQRPAAAPLQVRYNDANGYTARTIVSSAMREIRTAVSQSIGERAVDQLLVGFADVRQGLAQATDGAQGLAEGAGDADSGAERAAAAAGKLSAGASTLADGVHTAATGAGRLDTGAADLEQGTGDLAAGAKKLSTATPKAAGWAKKVDDGATKLARGARQASTGASALSSGLGELRRQSKSLPADTEKLAAGARSVADGNRQIADAVGTAAEGVDAAAQRVDEALDRLPEDDPRRAELAAALKTLRSRVGSVDAQTTKLAAGAEAVAAGNRKLADAAPKLTRGVADAASGAGELAGANSAIARGAGELSGGADTLHSGLLSLGRATDRLAEGAGRVDSGATELHAATGQLNRGLRTLDSGAAELATGAGDLRAGLLRLHEGTGKLAEGAGTLHARLAEAVGEVPNFDGATRDANADAIAAPVSLDTSFAHEAENNGEGLAPYFIGLSLYVGALILWMLLRPLNRRSLAAPVSALRVALGGYLPALLLGLVQAGLLLGVLVFGLDLRLAHPVAAVGFIALVSAAYLALQQAINILFGPAVARVLVLILLMLQLTSAGGTYPVVTSAPFFQALHGMLPMTQVVNGFRDVITGDLGGSFGAAVIYLTLLLVASLAVSTVAAAKQRVWTMKRLHPAVSL